MIQNKTWTISTNVVNDLSFLWERINEVQLQQTDVDEVVWTVSAKGRRDLQVLKIEECKLYLRKHELRLTGTKAVCIQRIQEHWRIKDGNGEKLYPRSSFRINCTGDVCQGDVVVFTQRVYEKFDEMKRSGNIMGKRTIVGRVVKESYGAAKQQHTFTVEVLWSKGVKRLPPLFPLLVKGRNLYRLRTYRQLWDNEAERSKVLDEKHKRGSEARNFRAMKKAGTANRGQAAPNLRGLLGHVYNFMYPFVGAKRQSHSHHTRSPSPKRRRTQESRPAFKSNTINQNRNQGRGKALILKPANLKKVTKQKTPESPARDLPRPIHNGIGAPILQQQTLRSPAYNYYRSQMPPQHNGTFRLANEVCSTSTAMRYPQGYSHSNHTHHSDTNPNYNFDPSSLPRFRDQAIMDRNGGMSTVYLRCSAPGCDDYQANNCVYFACWKCCRRTGRICVGHQLY
ncbi:hypothetical protein GIB67_003131 [Kingdonia uniflora]|uniref:SAP domain-containing protein n=1 Tax=Kingdonia uniflora TaxID=39325 RepID=A0A7J7N609_9MAGN|nr:hypothetical protein GIB67_003131 [Kingdonia uniflora]